MSTPPFRFADSERVFGAEVVAELDRIADEAPPMGAEAKERLRALFATNRRPAENAPVSDAA